MLRLFGSLLVMCLIAGSGCKKHAEIPGGEVVSIQYLKTFYNGYPLKITSDATIEATVVSSDMWGNFDNSLIVEDASGGIEIRIYEGKLFLKFKVGERIKIDCNGMTLREYGGKLELYAENSGNIFSAGKPVSEVEAHAISINDISYRYIDCLVRFSGTQFAAEELGKTWCDPDAYTDRLLVFNGSAETLAVRTAPGAAFARNSLPSGSGIIEGILTRFAGRYSLRIVRDDRLSMDGKRF